MRRRPKRRGNPPRRRREVRGDASQTGRLARAAAQLTPASVELQAPAEAYRKFDDLSKTHIDALRGLTKNIQDARLNLDTEAIKKSLKSYDDALERYIPPL